METKISDFAFFTILLFGGAAVIVIANVVLNNAKRKITKYLSSRGATNIDIKYEWGTYDRNTLTFIVDYTGVNGNRKRAKCKVHHIAFLVDEEIFWSNPLDLELNQKEKRMSNQTE